jgi:hypothetical protein
VSSSAAAGSVNPDQSLSLFTQSNSSACAALNPIRNNYSASANTPDDDHVSQKGQPIEEQDNTDNEKIDKGQDKDGHDLSSGIGQGDDEDPPTPAYRPQPKSGSKRKSTNAGITSLEIASSKQKVNNNKNTRGSDKQANAVLV